MNIVRNAVFSVVVVALFGWAMAVFYNANIDFAEIVKHPEPPWMIEINMMPVLALVVVGGVLSMILYASSKKKRKSWTNALALPPEFEESDEREQFITARACRASYISMWYAAPVVVGLLTFYPLISETVPYYPIIVSLLLPFVQILSYAISWKRNDR